MQLMWLVLAVSAAAGCGDDGVHHLADAPPGCNTSDCLGVTAAFAGLAWNIPCGATIDMYDCAASPTSAMGTVQGALPGTRYGVTLRFQGVVEQKTYTGGSKDGYWQTGGTPSGGDGYNIYSLAISQPPQTFYLNAGMSMIGRTWAIDYTETVEVENGATLMLVANPLDGAQILNIDDQFHPVTAPGATLVTQPYAGQFIQMDVVAIEALAN